MPDPAAAWGDEALVEAFESAFETLHVRISALMSIDFDGGEPGTIDAELKRIGTLRV